MAMSAASSQYSSRISASPGSALLPVDVLVLIPPSVYEGAIERPMDLSIIALPLASFTAFREVSVRGHELPVHVTIFVARPVRMTRSRAACSKEIGNCRNSNRLSEAGRHWRDNLDGETATKRTAGDGA